MVRESIAKTLLSVSFAVAIAGAVIPSQAGTTGNGITPAAKTHYSYCFGGLRKTVYFSTVFASAPAANMPDQNGPFGKYLTNTFGAGSNDGGQCITSEVMADTVNAKKQREAEFVWMGWKIVETKWAGVGAH